MATEKEELREKIGKYRAIIPQVGDPLTAQRIQQLIGELEDQLKGLAALPNRDIK